MWAVMCVCHHVCHTQARSCLSTGWALNRCFPWVFGTAAVLAQGGGGVCGRADNVLSRTVGLKPQNNTEQLSMLPDSQTANKHHETRCLLANGDCIPTPGWPQGGMIHLWDLWYCRIEFFARWALLCSECLLCHAFSDLLAPS